MSIVPPIPIPEAVLSVGGPVIDTSPGTTVRLGNTAPVNASPINGTLDVTLSPLEIANGRPDNNTISTFHVPGPMRRGEAMTTIVGAFRSHHSNDDPEWVESTDALLAGLLADEFSRQEVLNPDGSVAVAAHTCVVGRPAGWIGSEG